MSRSFLAHLCDHYFGLLHPCRVLDRRRFTGLVWPSLPGSRHPLLASSSEDTEITRGRFIGHKFTRHPAELAIIEVRRLAVDHLVCQTAIHRAQLPLLFRISIRSCRFCSLSPDIDL